MKDTKHWTSWHGHPMVSAYILILFGVSLALGRTDPWDAVMLFAFLTAAHKIVRMLMWKRQQTVEDVDDPMQDFGQLPPVNNNDQVADEGLLGDDNNADEVEDEGLIISDGEQKDEGTL
tara:strand:- start:693 stop:1049 length:357 start_codon:yes stop_codon:yes gene_type:complete